MAYLRPPAFQRAVFNPLAMRFGLGGARTLAIRGRRSGEERRVPVIPVEHDGGRYVVSARGESYWVKNLRETGTAELRGKDGTEQFRATELPVEERAPIIEAYREKAGRTVTGYWKSLPDPSDHPVFRLEPL